MAKIRTRISDAFQFFALASIVAGFTVMALSLWGQAIATAVGLVLGGVAFWLIGRELDIRAAELEQVNAQYEEAAFDLQRNMAHRPMPIGGRLDEGGS